MSQMDADHASLVNESGEYTIVDENKELEIKYQALVAEVDEKTASMSQQIESKTKGTADIEESMRKQIDQQKEDLQKQIDLYKEECVKKQVEEAELAKVAKEYRDRYEEFSKSIRQSNSTLNEYEKKVNVLNRRVNQLTDEKRKCMAVVSGQGGEGGQSKKKNKKGKKGKEFKEDEDSNTVPRVNIDKEIEQIKEDWVKEKQAMEAERAKV